MMKILAAILIVFLVMPVFYAMLEECIKKIRARIKASMQNYNSNSLRSFAHKLISFL